MALDNSTTIDNLMGAIQDKLSLPSLMLDDRLLHMCCATHIINLFLKDRMTVMDKGIERVREIVLVFGVPHQKEMNALKGQQHK
jgi:hypothetical protein